MRVLLIFIDGLGLGYDNASINPLVRFSTPFLDSIYGKSLTWELPKTISASGCMVPTDARLGIDGLPQSATGQTALFTGINAPQKLGRHVQAFPGPQLQKLLQQYGIMRQLLERGYTATSANMYTPDYLNLVAKRKRRHSATTLTILGAGLALRSVDDLRQGAAIYQDITNAMLPQVGVEDIPVIGPDLAGRRLVDIARDYDFTMFEYFQTDRCGHKQNWEVAGQITQILDRFLLTIYNELPEDMLVIVTSDHGNFEDLSVKTHTLNFVPTLLFGCGCMKIAAKINNLTDITPAIIGFLERDDSSD